MCGQRGERAAELGSVGGDDGEWAISCVPAPSVCLGSRELRVWVLFGLFVFCVLCGLFFFFEVKFT